MGGFHIMSSSREEGARYFFTYQNTDLPLLSTLYTPLSKQLISVLERSLQDVDRRQGLSASAS